MKPIEFGEFLKRSGITKKDAEFESWNRIEKVISLREIVSILFVSAMKNDYLLQLLRNIGLVGDPERKLFLDAKIMRYRTDPHELFVGQTFVQRSKYTAIIERFKDVFSGHDLPRGISKLTSQIVVGKDKEGAIVVAHYVPPIIEIHNGRKAILDGIHRNYIVKNAGTTIESVIISGIGESLPFETREWDDIKPVDEKPPLKERYFNLDPTLFRDLKFLGIDG